MVPNDTRIFFHISSKNCSNKTDSTRFQNFLFESMAEMKEMFETYLSKKNS